MEVDQKCFKIRNDCFHWVRSVYDEPYNLLSGSEIKRYIEEGNHKEDMPLTYEHVKGYRVNYEDCHNPWNIICGSDIEATVRVSQPPTKKIGDSNVSVDFHHDEFSIRELFRSIIGSDCWVVMSQDHNHHPVKVYFDYRSKKNSEKSDSVRARLMEDPSELITDLKNGYRICILMGYKKFVDEYFQYDPRANVYVHTVVRYYR
jgi:hypothetical protein